MDGYLDGELDPVTSQKIEQHLRDCRKCEQAYEVETAIAHAISRGAPYYKAPAELRQRVQPSLRDAVGAASAAALQEMIRRLTPGQRPSRSPRDTMELASSGSSYRLGRDYRFQFLASVTAAYFRPVPRDTTYSQSRPFAHGRPSYGRRFLRSAHCKTLAGYETRFCASSSRPFQSGFSSDWGSP